MYSFCPRCSKKLTKKAQNLFICKNCGLHLYENPRPTNAILFINEKNEILLIKRKVAPKKGYWDAPGGFVDLNESLEEGVKREIKEELGINLTKFDYIGSYPGRYLYKGINYYTLCFAFKAKLEEQKIISNKEIAQIKFFTSENIPFKKIAFTEVKNALKDYLSSFQQSKSSDDRK